MREAFKKTAEENTRILYGDLSEFLEGTWAIAKKVSDIIDVNLVRIKFEGKEVYSNLILRNTISDLCCSLDALERGCWRTLVNNLRMAFEDYCCAFRLHADPKAYKLFLKEKLDIPGAVTFVKKRSQGYASFGKLYGEFSKISHHSKFVLLARQIVSIEKGVVCYTHLKQINPTKLAPQITSLSFIAFLLLEIGVLAEEMCLDLIDTPYFGIKTEVGYQKRFDIPEVIFIQKLAEKEATILNLSLSSQG